MRSGVSTGFLDRMAAASRARADRLLEGDSPARLAERSTARAAPPRLRLDPRGFDLIAEVKRHSPSEGALAGGVDVASRTRSYASAGAAAVSVLTEPSEFGGSLDDLESAAAAVDTPVMRKDFLVDPIQVVEARASGAGGVLLIAAILPGPAIDAMVSAAAELGLFCLIEAFDADELDRAAAAARSGIARGATCLVGLNARDLRTLRVDPDRLSDLADRLPADVPCVAESGLVMAEDAARVRRSGYAAALVGTALMRSTDPAALVSGMLRAGREAA